MHRAIIKSVLRKSAVPLVARPQAIRAFHGTRQQFAIKPFLLADIGEGITEVQIIQWFVQPGARVEQFDRLCEVQSDKASVEITSRFDGVIKKLHYEADDMAIVGKPLVDIDIQSEISAEDEALIKPQEEQSSSQAAQQEQQQQQQPEEPQQQKSQATQTESKQSPPPAKSFSKGTTGKMGSLATPAVRHLSKDHNVDISNIQGTGKDGRVLKEDVLNYISSQSSGATSSAPGSAARHTATALEDKTVSLTPVQNQMFKAMTKSLNIPHFLYSDALDMTAINALRYRMNATAAPEQRLSVLPFLIKAVSLALAEFPLLNARLDTASNPSKPQIILRGAHNIGIAVDTPNGLLVPVIKGVQDLSVQEVASEARRLSDLARQGKLTSDDMSGGTFSVSNVGSIGGGVVAPVIVESQLAIVGVGRTKVVPAFSEDGEVIRREECTLSWSADHRVCDGATVARCADVVRSYLETPEQMLVKLR